MRIKDLTKADIGKVGYYIPSFGEPELGILKTWNEKFIFVVYPGNNPAKREHWDRYTSAATKPQDFYWEVPKKKKKNIYGD